jgi:hypothetical protein
VTAVIILALWRLLLTAASVLLLVLVPSADIVAFGLHEHAVVTPESGGDLTGSDNLEGPTISHHCEFSVSVGEVPSVIEIPMPTVVMADPPEPHASAPQYSPFVLLTPPRA